MIFLKATKSIQQNDKKLGQNGNQGSQTRLCQTRPRFSLLIFVVKENFASLKKFFTINHLADTINCSILNLGNKLNQNKIIDLVDNDITIHNTKFSTSSATLSIHQAVLFPTVPSKMLPCVLMGDLSEDKLLQLL